MTLERDILFVFNLETDLDSHVLANSHSWLEAFQSQKFKRVYVFSTHVGRENLGENSVVVELGGGTTALRIRALFRLSKALILITRHSRRSLVFHHMSTRTTLFPGVFIKLLGVPQGLWYSHSATPPTLKLGLRIVDLVFSSTPGSTSNKSHKFRYVGHGIDFRNFPSIESLVNIRRTGIVSLGRFARVKNLNRIIEAGYQAKNFPEVSFIGAKSDKNAVVSEIETLAKNLRVNVNLLDSIPHDEVPKVLSSFSFYFSGTPKSVDKATLEAASLGCIIISEEFTARELTGMNKSWRQLGKELPLTLTEQVQTFESLSNEAIREIRRSLMIHTREQNNVERTTKEIINQLRSIP